MSDSFCYLGYCSVNRAIIDSFANWKIFCLNPSILSIFKMSDCILLLIHLYSISNLQQSRFILMLYDVIHQLFWSTRFIVFLTILQYDLWFVYNILKTTELALMKIGTLKLGLMNLYYPVNNIIFNEFFVIKMAEK